MSDDEDQQFEMDAGDEEEDKVLPGTPWWLRQPWTGIWTTVGAVVAVTLASKLAERMFSEAPKKTKSGRK